MSGEPDVWKNGIDWNARVTMVLDYFHYRPQLKFGPTRENKAFALIDSLCAHGTVARSTLMQTHGLATHDDIVTIMSNMTMAMQGKGEGDVWRPEDGGWYKKIGAGEALTYIVCPGFAKAWVSISSGSL